VIDTDPRRRFAPEVLASIQDLSAAIWSTTDPVLIELARRRIAQLLGNDAELAARPDQAPELSAEMGVELARWPTSPAFGERERSTLALTEQFVIDVGSVQLDQIGAVAAHLGGDVLGFVQALYVLDLGQRTALALDRLFGESGTAADGGESGTAADGGESGTAADGGERGALADGSSDPDVMALIEELLRRIGRLDALDPVTAEVVRLRGARHHHCRMCQNARSLTALEAGADETTFDAIDGYEASDLPERCKVALRVTDAVITQPAAMTDELVGQVRRQFSPAETVELVCDVMRNAANKIAVVFGADEPARTDGIDYQRIDANGDTIGGLSYVPTP